MGTLSVFVDESGASDSEYYLLSLVFHNQDEPIAKQLALYERSFADKGIAPIPLHTSPLMNGHGDYANLPLKERKRHLFTFLTMLRHLPISYRTFCYVKREVPSEGALAARMRRDIVNLVFDHLAWFQSFDEIEVFYDGGQKVVNRTIRDAFEFALARNAVIFRKADPREYVLFQAADLACAIELAAQKYGAGQETATDRKMFGSGRDFRRNVLRITRMKRLR